MKLPRRICPSRPTCKICCTPNSWYTIVLSYPPSVLSLSISTSVRERYLKSRLSTRIVVVPPCTCCGVAWRLWIVQLSRPQCPLPPYTLRLLPSPFLFMVLLCSALFGLFCFPLLFWWTLPLKPAINDQSACPGVVALTPYLISLVRQQVELHTYRAVMRLRRARLIVIPL